MVGRTCRLRPARGVAFGVVAALLLTSGTALAQVAGMNGALGTPGSSPAVGGTRIPFGATGSGTAGLSPMPMGPLPGLAPSSSGITSTLGTAGLGVTGLGMRGPAGSASPPGNGLSPSVTPPVYPMPGAIN
jgi:hypothetical protein